MIVVAPGWSRRPVAESDASFFGDISKCTVMIVVIKTIFAVVGDVDVWPAVVIVVADGNAGPPSFIRDAALLSNIAKRAVMIVAQKHGLRRRLFALQSCHGRTIQQIDVEPAIVVII